MVILGGLEIVAAGYLIHKHNQNKKERARLEEEAAALEESSYPLFPAEQRPPRRHTHSQSHSQSQSQSQSHSHSHSAESDEERRERRRRRRERKEKEEEKLRYSRTNSAPPKMPQTQTQSVVAPGIVAGWPAHWKQSQIPPVQPPRIQTPQSNEYPQDVKYGFVPEVPHDQYPPYPPPPFSPGPGPQASSSRTNGRGRTGDKLEVRGRRERRSVSPRIGVYDDYSPSPSPAPRVRFSNQNQVLEDAPPKYRA